MSGTVAIDFGTARTKLAFRPPGGGRPELMRFAEDRPFAPSLFYLPPGDGPALWGDDAEDMLSEDPAGVLVALKCALSRPKVRANARSEAPTALLARLLADLRARAGQQVAHLGGRPPGRAALTAPALFGPTRRGCSGRRRWRPALRRRRLSPNRNQPRGLGWPKPARRRMR